MKQISLLIPQSTWYAYQAVVDDEVAEKLKYVTEDELEEFLEPYIDWESSEERYWAVEDNPKIKILSIKEVKQST